MAPNIGIDIAAAALVLSACRHTHGYIFKMIRFAISLYLIYDYLSGMHNAPDSGHANHAISSLRRQYCRHFRPLTRFLPP